MPYRDRVRETSTTIGSGAFELIGAAAGHQTFFDAFGALAGVFYCATDGVEWEVGIGTVIAGAPVTLSRDTILASSNGNAAVIFGAGTKDVFHVLPASAADTIGQIEVSDDGGTTSNPVRVLSFEAGLSLNIAGDVAEIDATGGGGGGGSGGALVTGFEMLYEADAVGGVANGNPLPTWPDQSANGYDLVEATNPPTFRSADAEDGLAFVEFDGVNDVLEAIRTAGLVAQEDVTIYLVARWTVQSGTKGLLCFSEAGENMAAGLRPFWQCTNAGQLTTTYNGTAYSYSGDHLRFGDWQVMALRLRDHMTRGTIMVLQGGLPRMADFGAAPSLPTLDFDRVRLGADYANFGAAGDFARADVRALAVYLTGHSDEQVRSMTGYLRDKWLADLLKHNP